MRVIFHGHSCVQITDGGNSVIIDPFLTGNPAAKAKPEDIRADYVLLTHAHPDHIADAEEIARLNDATIVATYELAMHYSWKGLKTVGMNIGGSVDLGFARAKMVPAHHSSGMVLEEEKKIVYMGDPGGFVITWNGCNLLHSGDTSLFGDMKIIGDQQKIDLAFLPIGDLLTMGPADALIAAEWLRAKAVVPVHHSTFPVIAQDGRFFAERLEERGIRGIPLKPGEEFEVAAIQEGRSCDRMKIDRIDHLVLTVRDLERTCRFYNEVLGMEIVTFGNGRKALAFGSQKLNLHEYGREFEPKASAPAPGAIDLCFISSTPLAEVIAHLEKLRIPVEEGPIGRTGAIGPITSVYIRDPDGNLVEIANYE